MTWINYFIAYLKAFPPMERGNLRAQRFPKFQ